MDRRLRLFRANNNNANSGIDLDTAHGSLLQEDGIFEFLLEVGTGLLVLEFSGITLEDSSGLMLMETGDSYALME